jgi:hypothetical protein
MDKKTTGIIATVAAALLCGCPGLASLCFGAFFAVISQIPGAEIDVFGSNNPADALTYGIGGVCVGIVFIIIPIVVGFLMLRKKPEAAPVPPPPPVSPPDEPVPPAI